MIEAIIKSEKGRKAISHKGDFAICVIGRKDKKDIVLYEGKFDAVHVVHSLGKGIKALLQSMSDDVKPDEDEDGLKTYLALEHGFLTAFYDSPAWDFMKKAPKE